MAKKKHQIIFNHPPPFPYEGDAVIEGNIKAKKADLNEVESFSVSSESLSSETVVGRNRVTSKQISVCNDTGYVDSHSRLHVDGCISLSPIATIPEGRSFSNGYLFHHNGQLCFKRIDDVVVNLSQCITLLESDGPGIKLFTEDGKKLKSITAKDGINISEDNNNIQLSLVNQIDTAANLGSSGEGIFTAVNGRTALFKKIVGGDNIDLSASGKNITINYSGRGFIELVSSQVTRDKKQYSDIIWSAQGGYSNAHTAILPRSRPSYSGINLQITNLSEGQEYTLYVTNKSKKVYRPFEEMIVYYSYGNNITDRRAAKLNDINNVDLAPGETGVVKMISTVENNNPWSFYISSISKII